MTVFIHIGPAKTGTTSIQWTMFRNAGLLRSEYAINYPSFAPNHWLVALPFLKQDRYVLRDNAIKRGAGTTASFLKKANKHLAGFEAEAIRYRTHVFSSECLSTLVEESATGLREFFVRQGLDTRVIIYVRHPAERISSLLSQQLRAGKTLAEAVQTTRGDASQPIRTFVQVFGKQQVIVRRFGAEYFVNGDLIDDFLTVVHGEPIPGIEKERKYASLSLPAALVADQLNQIAPRFSDGRGRDDFLDAIAGPKFLAPRPVVEQAVEAHEPAMKYLADEFGITFHEVDLSVFPETISYEFGAETLRSIALVLNQQSLARLVDKQTVARRKPRNLKARMSGLMHKIARHLNLERASA